MCLYRCVHSCVYFKKTFACYLCAYTYVYMHMYFKYHSSFLSSSISLFLYLCVRACVYWNIIRLCFLSLLPSVSLPFPSHSQATFDPARFELPPCSQLPWVRVSVLANPWSTIFPRIQYPDVGRFRRDRVTYIHCSRRDVEFDGHNVRDIWKVYLMVCCFGCSDVAKWVLLSAAPGSFRP